MYRPTRKSQKEVEKEILTSSENFEQTLIWPCLQNFGRFSQRTISSLEKSTPKQNSPPILLTKTPPRNEQFPFTTLINLQHRSERGSSPSPAAPYLTTRTVLTTSLCRSRLRHPSSDRSTAEKRNTFPFFLSLKKFSQARICCVIPAREADFPKRGVV